MEVENGDSIEVRISPDSRPARLQATFVAQPGGFMVGDVVHLSPVERVLAVNMSPGRYTILLHAQWQEGGPLVHHEVDYVFGIAIPGEPPLRAGCTSTLIGGILGIVLDSLDDRDRTAPDPYNGDGCRFNREISHVVLTLEGEDRRYVETFRLDPPSTRLSLPLPEDTVSESTGGPLLASYSRRYRRRCREATRLTGARSDKAIGWPGRPRCAGRLAPAPRGIPHLCHLQPGVPGRAPEGAGRLYLHQER